MFRFLLPIVVYLAVRLRKVLVPWGHWLMWAVCIGVMGGLLPAYTRAGRLASRETSLLDQKSRWLCIGAGMLLWVLARPARWFSRWASPLWTSRQELKDYVFPMKEERKVRRRRSLVEIVGGNQQRRRLVFLVQEATGLRRPSQWCKASVIWIAVFLAMLLTAGRLSGSAIHMFVTIAPLLALAVWLGIRTLHLDSSRRLAVGTPYAHPIGHIELSCTKTAVFSALYFLTGFLAAAGIAMCWPDASDSWARIATCAAVNLIQLWLLCIPFVCSFFTIQSLLAKGRVLCAILWAACCYICSVWLIKVCLDSALIQVVSERAARWGQILSSSIHAISYETCLAATGEPDALERLWAMRLAALRGIWQIDAMIWLVLATAVWLSFRAFVVRYRGRAHSQYRAALWAGRPQQPFFSVKAGGKGG